MATEIIMPALEMAQDTGLLVRWLKSEGEWVDKGEPLMEIETDKALLEIEAAGEGKLAHVSAQPGDEIPVGQVIALLVADGETVAEPAAPQKPPAGAATGAPVHSDAPNETGTSSAEASRARATPKARRLARRLGIDLSTVVGTGPGGSIQTSDLPEGAQHTSDTKDVDYVAEPIKGMRKTIAQRMQQSARDAAHISLALSVDMSQVQQIIERSGSDGSAPWKISPILCKAVALTLCDRPRLNAHLVDNEIRQFPNVHLGVAVAIDDGLVVPVVRNVESKDVTQIQTELADLAERARKRQLQGEEMKGATFSLSNLGMYGIEQFTSLVNPPEVAILSTGAVETRPVGVDGRVELRPLMTVTLNVDHRAIDGAVAAEFLRLFKQRLENPYENGLA